MGVGNGEDVKLIKDLKIMVKVVKMVDMVKLHIGEKYIMSIDYLGNFTMGLFQKECLFCTNAIISNV